MRERRASETNPSSSMTPDKAPSSGLAISTPWRRWLIADGGIGGDCGKTAAGLKLWLRREGARV